ncbi:high choriolytic enzyme 1-like [Pholidichthys leucotaenia]
MSPSISLLLLLLLGLSQAHPFMEEVGEDEYPVEEEDPVDITTGILEANNGSSEFLLEGDMVGSTNRNFMNCRQCLWRKGRDGKVEVPFVISNQYNNYEKRMIIRAMRDFHSKTCIRFVDRTTQYDYISFVNRDGCFSYVGRRGGRQVISLNIPGCIYFGIIQHEIIHALGFYHEHNRDDRDKHVQIRWENISPKMAFNFNKRPTDNLNTPYDYSSIMHYGQTAFSNNGRPTIIPIPNPNVQIGQTRGMSDWDIKRIIVLYC